MSLLAAAFVPAAPLLHPAGSTGAAEETADLRQCAVDAVRALVTRPDVERVVVIGAVPRHADGAASVEFPAGARGTLHGFGIDVDLGRGDGPAVLPTPLGLGAWWLDLAGHDGTVTFVGIAEDATIDEVADATRVIGLDVPAVLLVVGDGTACRTDKAPGAFDPRAEGVDAEIVRALEACDLVALADLDASTCAELKVSGRPAWQLAAACAAQAEGPWAGAVHAQEAPYGVGYVVASWRAA